MQSKFDITLYLKYFIFPIISIISIVTIYLILISPYLTVKIELDTNRVSKNDLIKVYETKLSILQKAKARKDDLNKYSQILNELVPSDESPAPLVGYIDSMAAKFNFNKIDENKNVADKDLSKNNLIAVRFNGRTVGTLSALNYLSALNNGKKMIINLSNIELFDDKENMYYRVSFMAKSIFNKNKIVSNIDTPVYDLMNDKQFNEFMDFYLK